MKNILEFLEKSAASSPSKTAITDDKCAVDFLRLMNESKAIACSLKDIGPGNPVAVLMDRGVGCVECMLAAVYAGCFYAVMDVSSPASRLRSIFDTLEPRAVITDDAHRALAEELCSGQRIVSFEEAVGSTPDHGFLDEIRRGMIDTDPLYVLFTSGSSGDPKGVVVSHRSVISYITWVTGEFGFDSHTSFGSQTPLYFSMSVTDLFSTLSCGSTYHMIPRLLFSFPARLIEYMDERRINTIYWVPSAMAVASAWDLFSQVKPRYLEKILFAGEVMPTKHLNYWRRHLPDCTYANLFGPTETTDICSFYVVDREFRDDEPLPIGRACDNCGLLLLKEDGEPPRPGSEGELAVRGSFLADGYYMDAEKTASAFPQNPLNAAYPERVYMTGDIVRLNDRGEYLYVSRKDQQIKRAGFRIEPGEIETAADALSGVSASAVIYHEHTQRLQLVYVGEGIQEIHLAAWLHGRIPVYMMPDDIVRINVMPLNANGKTDRKRLKEELAGEQSATADRR